MRDDRGNLTRQFELVDYAYKYYKAGGFDKIDGTYPDYFQTTKDISLQGHLRMQNTIQKYVDNSISKTINFPEGTSFESFKAFMLDVVTSDMSIKGLTTFREGTIQSILTDDDDGNLKVKEDEYRKRSFAYQVKRSSGLPSAHVHVTYNNNQVSQVFVVSKDVDFYKQMLPYCRLLSIMFNKEKNLEKLLEMLQELEDMDFVEGDETFTYNGNTYAHFLSAMKECIWDCLVEIGLIKEDEEEETEDKEQDSECLNCHAKNSMIKDGKCFICANCGSTPSGSACSI
jgi:ribonucleoside-diphosphate reductase alpha chain